MKLLRLLATVLALSFVAARLAAEEPTAAEMATWRKPAINKILAQKLVNELMAAHSELVVVGLHATAPGAKEQTMIATNLDRVGKKDDDDDKAVSTEHKIILAPNLKESNKFEVQVWLKDATGKQLTAAAGFVFKYKAGDSEIMMLTKALAFRDELAKKTPSFEALFAPAKL
jgi:ABC-type Zn2+ transport system substrate-binding protein/surface adhesin